MGDDLLEDAAHLERVAMLLVVEDVAPGDGGLVEMPDERLLLERQRREPVGVQLHHRGVVDPLEQVLALVGGGRAWPQGPKSTAGSPPLAASCEHAARLRTRTRASVEQSNLVIFSRYRKGGAAVQNGANSAPGRARTRWC